MINVRISTILTLKEILGQRETEMSVPGGSTLEALLAIMIKTWGEKLSSFLLEPESGQVRSYIRLMVNGQDIGFLNGMETALQEGDEILILPPVAGG